MAFTVIQVEHQKPAASLLKILRPQAFADKSSIRRIGDWFRGIAVGAYRGTVITRVGAVKATATWTFASTGPAADETVTICGTTFTAKSSGATGDQWNRSDTVATSAANLAAAINASATAKVTGAVIASSALGVVTVTSLVPGTVGNGIEISAGTAANTTLSSGGFTGGTNGTSHTLAAGGAS